MKSTVYYYVLIETFFSLILLSSRLFLSLQSWLRFMSGLMMLVTYHNTSPFFLHQSSVIDVIERPRDSAMIEPPVMILFFILLKRRVHNRRYNKFFLKDFYYFLNKPIEKRYVLNTKQIRYHKRHIIRTRKICCYFFFSYSGYSGYSLSVFYTLQV